MTLRLFRAAAAAGLLAILPTQAIAAQAAPACITPGEMRALATFAMPSAMSGLIDSCSPQIGASSFMATKGKSLVAAYAAGKDAAWPQARKAFFRLAGEGGMGGADKDTGEALGKLPDAALQPFVEGMIGAMVGSKLKPGQCVMADKLMRLLAPLPPENTAELLTTIIELADADKKSGPGGLAICK